MKNQMNFSQNAQVSLGKTDKSQKGVNEQSFAPRGEFNVEHWRGGILLAKYNFKNGIVDEGKDHIFDSAFDAATQITTWYMGLIDNVNFGALADTDDYDNIDQVSNDWEEFDLYDISANSTVRGTWATDPASGESISNSTQTIFDITGSGTVKGLFIAGGGANSSDKGDHASDGTLWATALFDQGDTAVVSSDQLKVTYTVSA